MYICVHIRSLPFIQRIPGFQMYTDLHAKRYVSVVCMWLFTLFICVARVLLDQSVCLVISDLMD